MTLSKGNILKQRTLAIAVESPPDDTEASR